MSRTSPRFREALRFQSHRIKRLELPVRAAALAYHSLLSIVPAVGLIYLVLNRLGLTREWRGHVERFLLSHLDVASSDLFVSTFTKLTVAGRGWGWLPLAIVLYTTFNLVRKSGDSLDLIIDSSVEEPRFRPRYVGLFIRRLLLMTILPTVLTFSLIVSAWLHREEWFRELLGIEGKAKLLSTPVAWIITILGVYIFYQFMPARPVRVGAALRAALVAGPALEIGKTLMTAFSNKAIAVQKIYGTLAAIPLLILWTQIIWLILLYSACLIRPKSPNQETRIYG